MATKKNSKFRELKDEELAALTFEDAIARLEEVVTQLQSGSIGIEEAFNLWEQGKRLHQLCRSRLDTIKEKLEELSEL